jgi:hypothetical protein
MQIGKVTNERINRKGTMQAFGQLWDSSPVSQDATIPSEHIRIEHPDRLSMQVGHYVFEGVWIENLICFSRYVA